MVQQFKLRYVCQIITSQSITHKISSMVSKQCVYLQETNIKMGQKPSLYKAMWHYHLQEAYKSLAWSLYYMYSICEVYQRSTVVLYRRKSNHYRSALVKQQHKLQPQYTEDRQISMYLFLHKSRHGFNFWQCQNVWLIICMHRRLFVFSFRHLSNQ